MLGKKIMVLTLSIIPSLVNKIKGSGIEFDKVLCIAKLLKNNEAVCGNIYVCQTLIAK